MTAFSASTSHCPSAQDGRPETVVEVHFQSTGGRTEIVQLRDFLLEQQGWHLVVYVKCYQSAFVFSSLADATTAKRNKFGTDRLL